MPPQKKASLSLSVFDSPAEQHLDREACCVDSMHVVPAQRHERGGHCVTPSSHAFSPSLSNAHTHTFALTLPHPPERG
eukprot:6210799-Pleurochrysis_carterae.AAC.1